MKTIMQKWRHEYAHSGTFTISPEQMVGFHPVTNARMPNPIATTQMRMPWPSSSAQRFS